MVISLLAGSARVSRAMVMQKARVKRENRALSQLLKSTSRSRSKGRNETANTRYTPP